MKQKRNLNSIPLLLLRVGALIWVSVYLIAILCCCTLLNGTIFSIPKAQPYCALKSIFILIISLSYPSNSLRDMKEYLPLNTAKSGTVPRPKDETAKHPRKTIWWNYLFSEESHPRTQLLTAGKFIKNRIYCCIIRFLIHEYTTHNHIWPSTMATWKLFCNHKTKVRRQSANVETWNANLLFKIFKNSKPRLFPGKGF